MRNQGKPTVERLARMRNVVRAARAVGPSALALSAGDYPELHELAAALRRVAEAAERAEQIIRAEEAAAGVN
jgi:hypothetical protein